MTEETRQAFILKMDSHLIMWGTAVAKVKSISSISQSLSFHQKLDDWTFIEANFAKKIQELKYVGKERYDELEANTQVIDKDLAGFVQNLLSESLGSRAKVY